jgi:hypothetical protein
VTPLGKGINFLPHLGFSSSSFGLINLQVPKPAQADLQNIQFKAELREFHSEFSSRPVTGVRGFIGPQSCIVHTCTKVTVFFSALRAPAPKSLFQSAHWRSVRLCLL